MLIPIKLSQISRLIPAVGTGGQFKYIGGIINFLISITQIGNQTYNLWLILCVVFFLYILWGPILESSRKNLQFRKYKFFSIFDGYVSDIYKTEKIESSREQSNRQGRLEVINKKRTWLVIELEDEDGYLDKITFPINNRNFDRDINLTDAWLPDINLWVGDYPYLLRPAFEEICYLYLK